MYGERYICNHPVYDRCTLFKIGDRGLAVIQQRFNAETKKLLVGRIGSMWAFKMKPLPRKRWETVFDRKDI